MNTRKFLSLALVTATALTACTEQQELTPDTVKPMKVNVATNLVSTSRAIIDGNTMPTDAIIGVALVDNSETTYDGTSYANVMYTTTDGSTWNTTSVPLLSATSGKAVAYYPYSETADYNAINVETASQTDYLYSTWVEGISNAAPTVNFGMEHALSAFRVLLKKTNDYNAVAKATRIQITSDAFVEQATLDATTGALSGWNGEGSVTVDIPQGGQTLTTTEQYTDIMVVPAENAGTKVKFVITVEDENDSTRDYSVEPTFTTAMLQGKCYQFTLTLSPTEMEVTNVTVTPWAQVESAGEGEMKPLMPGMGTIDLATAPNGVYAVAQNGLGVNLEDANSTCVAVALITDNQRIMIAKENATDGTNATLYWGYNLYGKDVAGIANMTYTVVAKNDFNGKANTAAIIAAYTEHGVEMNSRDMCKVLQDLNTAEEADWYVPACGQLYEMNQNKAAIEEMLAAIGGTNFPASNTYWSSSEYNSNDGWDMHFDGSKNDGRFVRFVKDLN